MGQPEGSSCLHAPQTCFPLGPHACMLHARALHGAATARGTAAGSMSSRQRRPAGRTRVHGRGGGQVGRPHHARLLHHRHAAVLLRQVAPIHSHGLHLREEEKRREVLG